MTIESGSLPDDISSGWERARFNSLNKPPSSIAKRVPHIIEAIKVAVVRTLNPENNNTPEKPTRT